MDTRRTTVAVLGVSAVLALAGGGWFVGTGVAAPKEKSGWEERLAEVVPLYGHRNWIAIVDSAYPAQTSAGVETVVTGADQLKVVDAVLGALGKAKHVRPVVYTDAELACVPERYAPGIGAYRDGLAKRLREREMKVLPHEKIIGELDEAGKTFQVLILKTDLTLPYTSVFIQLDCGYWSPEAETALRDAMWWATF